MKFFFIFLVLLLLLFLETSFFSFPLVLGGILLLSVLYKEYWIFLVAFVIGILLDVLMFQVAGGSSLFFTVLLGVLFLYERKYEIQSMPFVTIFTFLASLIYGFIFHEQHEFLEAIMVTVLIAGVFYGLSLISSQRGILTQEFH